MQFASLLLAAAPALSSDLCEGNGVGAAYIEVGPAYLGGPFVHDIGSPNVPNGICFFSISGGFQETVHPLVGPICLNIFSPFYNVFVLPTGPDGNLHFALGLPAIPSWVGNPPFYSNVTTVEGGQISISKTVPLWFENPDSWTPVGAMGEGRMYHTATYLGASDRDNRIKILVAGGGGGTLSVPAATLTTEIFDPLSRTFAPGPDMAVERTGHTATRLPDGKILIAGGQDTSGVCHTSCELFDLVTGTLTPTGSMTSPRSAHTATLLGDGRVLVTGGFADYQSTGAFWADSLNTSQDTAEVYDPLMGTWTALAQTMGSRRSGHRATLLADGSVLLTGGITGGGIGSLFGNLVPFFTGTTDVFDAGTGSFALASPLPIPRAFHGVSVLGNGHVLVTGGLYTGGPQFEAYSTTSCVVWDGSAWTSVASLPQPTAWHNQLTLDDGAAFVCGGLQSLDLSVVPKSFAAVHDGTFVTEIAAIGVNVGIPSSAPVARGAMTATRMHDGAVLVLGGTDGAFVEPSAQGFVYTPGL